MVEPLTWRRLGHELGLGLACVAARLPRSAIPGPPVRVMGLAFDSPLGIAAGFDRQGRLGRRAGALGFAFNEIGSLDLASPPPLPRVMPGTARLGLNLSLDPHRPLATLCAGLERVEAHVDYLMLNLINPASASLLDPEQRPRLRRLLTALRTEQSRLDALGRRRPLAVKLRCLPGQTPLALAELLLELGYDGLLAAHDPGPPATRQRYRAWQDEARQAQACAQLEQLQRLCRGDLALMSVGGIQSAEHLQARLAAGAELVQVHTALLHAGPWLARRLLR